MPHWTRWIELAACSAVIWAGWPNQLQMTVSLIAMIVYSEAQRARRRDLSRG